MKRLPISKDFESFLAYEIPHPADANGEQKVYRFPNNYGASLVIFDGSYGGRPNEEGNQSFELAVIAFPNEFNKEFTLCYDTHITEDVLGYQTADEVEATLKLISELPKIEFEKVAENIKEKEQRRDKFFASIRDGSFLKPFK